MEYEDHICDNKLLLQMIKAFNSCCTSQNSWVPVVLANLDYKYGLSNVVYSIGRACTKGTQKVVTGYTKWCFSELCARADEFQVKGIEFTLARTRFQNYTTNREPEWEQQNNLDISQEKLQERITQWRTIFNIITYLHLNLHDGNCFILYVNHHNQIVFPIHYKNLQDLIVYQPSEQIKDKLQDKLSEILSSKNEVNFQGDYCWNQTRYTTFLERIANEGAVDQMKAELQASAQPLPLNFQNRSILPEEFDTRVVIYDEKQPRLVDVEKEVEEAKTDLRKSFVLADKLIDLATSFKEQQYSDEIPTEVRQLYEERKRCANDILSHEENKLYDQIEQISPEMARSCYDQHAQVAQYIEQIGKKRPLSERSNDYLPPAKLPPPSHNIFQLDRTSQRQVLAGFLSPQLATTEEEPEAKEPTEDDKSSSGGGHPSVYPRNPTHDTCLKYMKKNMKMTRMDHEKFLEQHLKVLTPKLLMIVLMVTNSQLDLMPEEIMKDLDYVYKYEKLVVTPAERQQIEKVVTEILQLAKEKSRSKGNRQQQPQRQKFSGQLKWSHLQEQTLQVIQQSEECKEVYERWQKQTNTNSIMPPEDASLIVENLSSYIKKQLPPLLIRSPVQTIQATSPQLLLLGLILWREAVWSRGARDASNQQKELKSKIEQEASAYSTKLNQITPDNHLLGAFLIPDDHIADGLDWALTLFTASGIELTSFHLASLFFNHQCTNLHTFIKQLFYQPSDGSQTKERHQSITKQIQLLQSVVTTLKPTISAHAENFLRMYTLSNFKHTSHLLKQNITSFTNLFLLCQIIPPSYEPTKQDMEDLVACLNKPNLPQEFFNLIRQHISNALQKKELIYVENLNVPRLVLIVTTIDCKTPEQSIQWLNCNPVNTWGKYKDELLAKSRKFNFSYSMEDEMHLEKMCLQYLNKPSVTNLPMNAIAAQLAKINPLYKYDKYHVFCAQLILSNHVQLFNLSPSQGKTYIMALLFSYIKQKMAKTCAVLVANNALKKQMTTMVTLVADRTPIMIKSVEDLRDYRGPPFDYLLVDEVDYIIRWHYLLILNNQLICVSQLQDMLADNIIGITANTDQAIFNFGMNFWNWSIAADKPYSHVTLKSLIAERLKLPEEYKFELHYKQQRSDLLQSGATLIQQDVKEGRSCWIFANAREQKTLRNLLKAQYNHLFVTFSRETLLPENFQTQIIKAQTMEQCLILMSYNDFPRGINVVLGETAPVHLFEEITYESDLLQIAARSNRLRGDWSLHLYSDAFQDQQQAISDFRRNNMSFLMSTLIGKAPAIIENLELFNDYAQNQENPREFWDQMKAKLTYMRQYNFDDLQSEADIWNLVDPHQVYSQLPSVLQENEAKEKKKTYNAKQKAKRKRGAKEGTAKERGRTKGKAKKSSLKIDDKSFSASSSSPPDSD